MLRSILIVLIASIQVPSFAQDQLKVIPSLGYMWNSKIQFREGVLDLTNAPSAGIALNVELNERMEVELAYTWAMNADLIFKPFEEGLYDPWQTGLNIHHLTLNSLHYFTDGVNTRPYAIVGAGASMLDLEEEGVKNVLRFSFNLGLGLYQRINDKLGCRIHARMVAPLEFEGVGAYAGAGSGGVGGVGLTLNASVPVFMFDLGAGLVIIFGE